MDKIQSIVVPTDFSALADAAAARAASLARLDGAVVHVVHALAFPLLVNPFEFSTPANLWENLRQAAQAKLEQTRKAIEAKGVAVVRRRPTTRWIPPRRSPTRCTRTEPTSS